MRNILPHGKYPKLLTLALVASSAFACPVFADTAAVQAPAACVAISSRADALIARPEYAAYRGWLKYLEFRVKSDAVRFGAESKEAKEALARLEDWTAKIEADPNLISKLRGVQEWAYESSADGSGQPFRINIPTDYNPSVATAASVYCHGYSGSHTEHTAGWKEKTGAFDVAVLGRARGGFYMSLSEKDVLDVVSYVKAHWNIDGRRVRLNGGSMGGFASFWLTARHPDLWASARPDCGFAFSAPLGNLLQTPIYSLHSKDDPVVSIAADDGPLKHLVENGGNVIYEETNGFGHGVWNFVEGNTRAGEWEGHQVAPACNEVRHIDFTALDGVSDKAWWAEVAEWGNEDRAAHFALSAGRDNTLYAHLDNIRRLRIDIANSPFDRKSALQVSVNGGIAFAIPAPLPEDIEIENGANGWTVAKEAAPLPFRLHTPGGATMVYDGSPILIVYGTKGTAEENAAILVAATAASRSPNASWPDDDIDRSQIDKVSHYQNLYGNLPMKADADVTDADLARCNVVIIGTDKQNALAAKLAKRLPAKFDGGKIVLGNGRSVDAKGNALGLTYYDPAAPERLVLWLASEDVAFYKPGSVLPQILAGAWGADAVVMNAEAPTVATSAAFDSRWNFIADHSDTLPASCDEANTARFIASVTAKAVHADFGVSSRTFYVLKRCTPAVAATSGVTTYGDLARFYYNSPIYTVTLSGAELADMAGKLKAAKIHAYDFSPNFDETKLVSDKAYTVSLTEAELWSVPATGFLLTNSTWTGINAGAAILKAGGK
jgi:hypothetical protein